MGPSQGPELLLWLYNSHTPLKYPPYSKELTVTKHIKSLYVKILIRTKVIAFFDEHLAGPYRDHAMLSYFGPCQGSDPLSQHLGIPYYRQNAVDYKTIVYRQQYFTGIHTNGSHNTHPGPVILNI